MVVALLSHSVMIHIIPVISELEKVEKEQKIKNGTFSVRFCK